MMAIRRFPSVVVCMVGRAVKDNIAGRAGCAWAAWTVASGAVCPTHTDRERNDEERETRCCAVAAAKATRTDVSAHEETALGILVEGPGRTAAPPPVRGWLWSSRGHPGADRPGAAAPSRQGCVGRRAGKGLVSHRAAGFNRATT